MFFQLIKLITAKSWSIPDISFADDVTQAFQCPISVFIFVSLLLKLCPGFKIILRYQYGGFSLLKA